MNTQKMPGNSSTTIDFGLRLWRELRLGMQAPDEHGFIELTEDNLAHLARTSSTDFIPLAPRHWQEWIRFLTGEGKAVPNPQLSFVY